jgi:hypothetical protein
MAGKPCRKSLIVKAGALIQVKGNRIDGDMLTVSAGR